MTDEKPAIVAIKPIAGAKAVTRVARNGLDTARTAALEAAEKTAQAIDGNPVAVLVGGLTVGLIAGALLPRAKTEEEILRPVGARIKEGASYAVKAARDAGLAELAAAGISRDAVRDQINRLIDAVGQAATRASEAATTATESVTVDAKPAKIAKSAKASIDDNAK